MVCRMEERQGSQLGGECRHASWLYSHCWLPHCQFPPPPMASRPFLHLLAGTMFPVSWMNLSWPKPKKYFPSFSLSDLSTLLAWLATNSSWKRFSEHSLLLLYLLLLPGAAALVQVFHDLPVHKAWCLWVASNTLPGECLAHICNFCS